MPEADGLYERDFYLWTGEQARQLREQGRGANVPLDWKNLAEEIESLGGRDRRELRSRLDTIFEHLLKLAFSREPYPRPGWQSTVVRERREIEAILEQSPSLSSAVESWRSSNPSSLRRAVARELEGYGETDAAARVRRGDGPEIEAKVLDDWFPTSASA